MDVKDKSEGLQRTRKIDFAELFEVLVFATTSRRECFDPFGVQVLFELYRWMMDSAGAVKVRYQGAKPRQVYPDILAYIGGDDQRNSRECQAFGVDWRDQIRGRLMRALRSGGIVARWRADQKIDPAKPKSVPLLHYKKPPTLDPSLGHGEAGVAGALDALFALGDGRYHVLPSKTNRRSPARRATGVRLFSGEIGWRVMISYRDHESSWTHPGEVQGVDEPFFDFIVRARKGFEKMLSAPCVFLRPPRPRVPACSAGWSGNDPKRGEIIGGAEVKDLVKKLDLAVDGFTPILLGLDAPSAVTFGRLRHDSSTDPERYRIARCDHQYGMTLTEEQVKVGRARYMLTKKVYELSFLDLPKDTRFRAEDQFLEDGLGSPGSALRKCRGAAAFVKSHPRDAWHDEFNMRCHGRRCDDDSKE